MFSTSFSFNYVFHSFSNYKFFVFVSTFDLQFYFVMNVAVGGTNGFFPDTWTNAGYAKPWNNQSPTAFLDFWNAKNLWYPTWNPDGNDGEDAAMAIDYVKVWKMKPDETKY